MAMQGYIGKYEVLERIAVGTQGTVYRAWDGDLEREVAIKVMNQVVTQDPSYLEALSREARLSATLDHPHIITIHEFQVEADDAYIAMEYAPDSLETQIREGERFTWQRGVELGIQIAQALHHAHERGVVHRDIKPGNVLISEEGEVKVCDFGIARALDLSLIHI